MDISQNVNPRKPLVRRCAQAPQPAFLRSVVKQFALWCYQHRLLPLAATQNIIDRLALWEA